MKIKIDNDLFDISKRLKEIDPAYEVYFETDLQKYVLWAFGVRQTVLPYDELDVRTLDYVYHTRRENADTILREIDESNRRKEREEIKKMQDEVENETSRRLRLSHL